MLFSPPQSWPLDICSTAEPGCLKRTLAKSSAAVGRAQAPCQLRFPLGESPFPQQDLHGFHMGLCPEVRLTEAVTARQPPRSWPPTLLTSCARPFPLPDHLTEMCLYAVKMARVPGLCLETCQGISPLRRLCGLHLEMSTSLGSCQSCWAVTCGDGMWFLTALSCLSYTVPFALRSWQVGKQLID